VWHSFSEFIGRAAQIQPLLLVLEDLHWADESTLLLTEYLAPLLPAMPVLVIGTYRDVEVDPHHPLARMIEQLAHRHLVEQVSLRRLSFDGVGAMLRTLTGQAAPEELGAADPPRNRGQPVLR
jgi:predicted ATPase